MVRRQDTAGGHKQTVVALRKSPSDGDGRPAAERNGGNHGQTERALGAPSVKVFRRFPRRRRQSDQ